MKQEEYRNMRTNDETHWWFLGMAACKIALLERFYKPSQRIDILEAGCGTGWFTKKLEKFGAVTAVDIEEKALEICRQRGITALIKADIAKIPVQDSLFDLVVCSEVIYHTYVPDDVAVMREFKRILKPGGRVFISVPAHQFLFSPHDVVNLTRQRYSKKQVRELFEREGLDVEFITYANFFLFPIVCAVRMFQKITHAAAASDVKKTIEPVNTILFAVLRVESLLLRYISLPQGLSILCIGRKSK